jgi:hypothetical protein
VSNNRPWDFDEARIACRKASQRQEQGEEALRKAYIDRALAQERYRKALAEKILELRGEGYPATLCLDLAKGHEEVADLRCQWDVAEGVCEALLQAAWRFTADRKDAQRFAGWSERREFAEAGGYVGNPAVTKTIGAGR